MASGSSDQAVVFELQPAKDVLESSQRTNAKLLGACVTDGWTYLIFEDGTLTVQETFRCSADVSAGGRGGTLARGAIVAVQPHSPQDGFLALHYHDTPGQNGSAQPLVPLFQRRLGSSARCDVAVTACNGAAVALRRLRNPGGVVVTAALWLPGASILLGTAAGACHLVQTQPVGARGKLPNSVPREPVWDLHQFRGEISALGLLGGSEARAAHGAGGAPLCVLVATACALLAILVPAGSLDTPRGSLDTLKGRQSASILAGSLVVELDKERNRTPSLLADTPERPSSYVQSVAWLTEAGLQCYEVSAQASDIAGGWDVMVGGRERLEVARAHLLADGERAVALAAEQWHVLVLVAHGGAGRPGAAHIVVLSRISGSVVQRIPWQESLGEPLALVTDPVATGTAPRYAPEGALSSTVAVHAVGDAGAARVCPTAAAFEVWGEFVATGNFAAAREAVEQLTTELDLAALDSGAAGSAESTSAARDRLASAMGRVLVAEGRSKCKAGDYVGAADALGSVRASVAASTQLPDFREVALWFQASPSDDAAVAASKAAGLERYLVRKLRQYRSGPRDAAATCLALWLLETLLARRSQAEGAGAGSALVNGGSIASAAWPEATVQGLLSAYRVQLPYEAVERVLRESGSWKDRRAAARLYEDWSGLFLLSLPDDVGTAIELLPRLPATELPSHLAAVLHTDPAAACRALSAAPALAGLPAEVVTSALAAIVKPGAPVASRAAAMGYLEAQIYGRGARSRDLHDLYVVALALADDPAHFQRYLGSEVSRRPLDAEPSAAGAHLPDPFAFDGPRAARLARMHGKRAAAVAILAGLGEHADALALASSYEERVELVEEVPGADEREQLWLSLIEIEVDAAEGDADTGSGERGASGLDALDRCFRDWGERGAPRLEEALARLPEQRTLHGYQRVLLRHMEATSARVQDTLESTRRAAALNSELTEQLHSIRRRTAAFSLDEPCSCCGVSLRSRPPVSVPHGGALPPLQVYASGAACHTGCVLERVLLTTADGSFRARLRALAQGLASAATAARPPRGDTAAKVAAQQHELAMYLKEGDPLCSEALVRLVARPFGASTRDSEAMWALPGGTSSG